MLLLLLAKRLHWRQYCLAAAVLQSRDQIGATCLSIVFIGVNTAVLLLCRVVIKLGPQQDMGVMLPMPTQGWRMCIAGHDFAVWEKGLLELPAGTSSNESTGNDSSSINGHS